MNLLASSERWVSGRSFQLFVQQNPRRLAQLCPWGFQLQSLCFLFCAVGTFTYHDVQLGEPERLQSPDEVWIRPGLGAFGKR